jgi:hypothetical protein
MMMRVMACCLSPRIKLLTYRELEGNNQPVDGYSPSPGGLLEIGRNQYLDPLWLREHYPDNSLVKIFHEGLPYLPSASGFFKEPNYTIIFMRRSEEEINASVERTEKYLKAQTRNQEFYLNGMVVLTFIKNMTRRTLLMY